MQILFKGSSQSKKYPQMWEKVIIFLASPPARETLCINGLAGRELANRVHYEMKSAPEWVKKYYEGSVKYSKSDNKQPKTECPTHFLSDEGWSSSFSSGSRRMSTPSRIGRRPSG